MISNNKNKYSKELTLEEIIHKSKFRKNIDNICLLENKINKDFPKPTHLVNTPIQAFKKPSLEFDKCEHFQSKKSVQSRYDPHKKIINSVTSRTMKSYKQPVCDPILNDQAHNNNFKTITRDQFHLKKLKKSKESNLASLERTKSLRNKTKKGNQFLCVNGASGNVVLNYTKPLTAQATSRECIPEYQIKKYQTLVQLGSQLQGQQKFRQSNSIHQTIQSKTYHSFMATKYKTSSNLRQKSVKSKSSTQSKFNHKIMLTEELVKKKIQNKEIKTEQKMVDRVENAEESIQTKTKKMKKYELILNMNFQQELTKQKRHKIKQQMNSQADQAALQAKKELTQQILEQQLLQENIKNQEIMNKTSVKGFKGKKVKSTVQMKNRYFVPDFIKPSLNLLVFEQNLFDKIKTQQKQSINKRSEPNQVKIANRTFQELSQSLAIKQFVINSKPDSQAQNLSDGLNLNQQSKEIQNQEFLSNQQQQPNVDENQGKPQKKKIVKSKAKIKTKNMEDGQICAWNQSNYKNTIFYREFQYQLDF